MDKGISPGKQEVACHGRSGLVQSLARHVSLSILVTLKIISCLDLYRGS